jgi:hypothetical protein
MMLMILPFKSNIRLFFNINKKNFKFVNYYINYNNNNNNNINTRLR